MTESARHANGEKQAVPPLLFEMMRSFLMLAHTLNLTIAVKELGSTRQTLRRHIMALEEQMGVTLFVVEDRRYHLTEAGRAALPEARELVSRGKYWVRGQSYHTGGLSRLAHHEANGWSFYQQHQPISNIWDADSPLLREATVAWARSGGWLEDKGMAKIRPHVLVYRDSPSGWICVELGEESFYSRWWGWRDARSAIGRPLGEFPGGEDFAQMLEQPFREIQASRGVRLDEVVTRLPREKGGKPVPVAYQRLLLGGRFPDGSFALIAVVDRSEKIGIAGLDQSVLEAMPADAITSFETSACNI